MAVRTSRYSESQAVPPLRSSFTFAQLSSRHAPKWWLAIVLPWALTACDSTSSGTEGGALVPIAEDVSDRVPYQEIIDQGVAAYLGLYVPESSEAEGDAVVHRFAAEDGPLCLDGSAYNMSTRDQQSDDLVIFLEGGGGCWSELCLANETAEPGVPRRGILDPDLAGNPLANANVAYFPYCDGSLFAGDVDHTEADYGKPNNIEYQRGLKNLSAGLDVTVGTFPNPSRIILAGNSGGAFGTIFALPLVRQLYPDVPIEVINDSGLGVAVDDNPDFILGRIEDWNAVGFFPENGCPDCLVNGHMTEYFRWQMQEDPNFRLAMLTSKQDFVIGTVFLGVGNTAFETSVLRELPAIETFAEGRMRSWIQNGSAHTFIQRDVTATAGGVTALDWLSAFLDRRDDDWQSTVDE